MDAIVIFYKGYKILIDQNFLDEYIKSMGVD